MAKPKLTVVLDIGHSKPTAAQLAAWNRAWRALSAMPMPPATSALAQPSQTAEEAKSEKGEGEA